MENLNNVKKDILSINQDVRRIIETALSIDGLFSSSMNAWHLTTAQVERQLAEETIRVAVVGSIKSGKSTLVNALFAGDYLKRGAGVVTSIITKLRPGNDLRAELEFKTWDEINVDINQALILFSSTESDLSGEKFDVNREKDRLRLRENLAQLNTEQLISDGARDPNSLLLAEYLKGYDRVKGFVSFKPITRTLESDHFHEQKDFVGEESLAVYLKDVILRVKPPEAFGENIEIADCQGSDSPNPLHLAAIQDYLVQSHLIIYVVSSRTGVRQADIKFLTLIKNMGLTKNILYVLNTDFSEHENLDDLKHLARRVEEEIGMIMPSPRMFTFSALYNLFTGLESKEPKDQVHPRRDRLRLEQWREEVDMVVFADEETERFLDTVVQKISLDRFAVILGSNLERLSSTSFSMRDWLKMNLELLTQDAGKIEEAFLEMDRRRETFDQTSVVIKDTLVGTTQKLKKDLAADVERFFDPSFGEILNDVIHYIDTFDLSARDYENDLQTSGFLPTLYRIFQTLQQTANRFIAETINPKLVIFIRRAEQRVEEVFGQVAGPFSLMTRDAVGQHERTMKELGISLPERPFKAIRSPSVASVKSDTGLSIPTLTTTMRYTARIKTEAILRLGLYNTVKSVKKLLKKPVSDRPDSALRSLDHSVQRIKEQMKESIRDQFMDYKENLKYQYVFRLVDTISSRLYESLTDRMRTFSGSLQDMKGLVDNERVAKDQLVEQFASMQTSLSLLVEKIANIEQLVESGSPS